MFYQFEIAFIICLYTKVNVPIFIGPWVTEIKEEAHLDLIILHFETREKGIHIKFSLQWWNLKSSHQCDGD
jgi:hypothetical protein